MSLTFKLNEAPPQPTISVEDLNAELVKMRKVVKSAKVIVFRDMLQYINRLRKKLSKANTSDRLKNKLAHREAELNLLRELSVNRVCKLILADEKDKSELARFGHMLTAQDRLIARMSQAKPVATFVEQFRQEHPDWRSLTHYLLYKNISGKWKSREQKKRNRTVRGSLPLPPAPDSDRLMDNVASEDPTSYRVPIADPVESDFPNSPPPISHNVDLDSDAASDIADDLVQRILQRKGSQSKFTESYKSTDGTKMSADHSDGSVSTKDAGAPTGSDGKRDTHQNKKKNKKKDVRFSLTTEVPASDTSSDNQPRKVRSIRQTDLDDEKSSSDSDHKPQEKHSRQSTVKRVPTPYRVKDPIVDLDADDDDDDDNPLGTDDVAMNRKMAARTQRARQRRPQSTRNPPPLPFGNRLPARANRPSASIPFHSKSKPGNQPMNVSTGVETLHPSWQAKREQKLKANLKSIVSTVSQAPKHIVFDG